MPGGIKTVLPTCRWWPGTALGLHYPRCSPSGDLEEVVVDARKGFPHIVQTVLDCTDVRELAEFYRQLLGYQYRPGDEPKANVEVDWLVLRDADGTNRLAFQQVAKLPKATWPEGPIPQQLHLDLSVP